MRPSVIVSTALTAGLLFGCAEHSTSPVVDTEILFKKGGPKPELQNLEVEFLRVTPADVVEGAPVHLTGENSEEKILVEGDYTLTYTVSPSACDPGGLVQLFNGVDVTSADVTIVADKKKDRRGNYSPRGRVHVLLRDVVHPDDPDHLYHVQFFGLGSDPEFDAEAITFTESEFSTVVMVPNSPIEVEKHLPGRKKNVDAERCPEVVADYTFRVEKR